MLICDDRHAVCSFLPCFFFFCFLKPLTCFFFPGLCFRKENAGFSCCPFQDHHPKPTIWDFRISSMTNFYHPAFPARLLSLRSHPLPETGCGLWPRGVWVIF